MRYRTFPATGWQVSELALGTVELGLEYGIATARGSNRPSAGKATALVREALSAGVNLIDTAPGYGDSEALVGEALQGWQAPTYVATKVPVPARELDPAARRKAILASLDRSRRRLGRDVLDLVQIHNATADDLTDACLQETMFDALAAGTVTCLGASVYGSDDAEAAVGATGIVAVQLAYNLLDRRAERACRAADAKGTALLLRSALLKGALTERRHHLPARLQRLRAAADGAAAWASEHELGLAEAALRFVLSRAWSGAVLVGVSSRMELEAALAAAAAGPLPPDVIAAAAALKVDDDDVVDPRRWGLP